MSTNFWMQFAVAMTPVAIGLIYLGVTLVRLAASVYRGYKSGELKGWHWGAGE